MKTLSLLFQDPPGQWGLRGDPYLWEEMKAIMGNLEFPSTETELAVLLQSTYRDLTGQPLAKPTPVLVERYARGGMSSGQVSPEFWAEVAVPLLLKRYRELE